MAYPSYSTQPSEYTLEEQIKTLLKDEFEKSVTKLCSEEERKAIPGYSEDYSEHVTNNIIQKIENPIREKKLDILYNHEKHYLDILKEYKEEIKFASSLQAEIRKEEATFFSSTLKDVCSSLKETQVDSKYQIQWIFDLVSSYTSSLKLSSKLAEEHVINLLGEIQKEAAEVVNEN